MRIFCSHYFLDYAKPETRTALIDAFKWFKETPDREYKSLFFGKDCALVSPRVGGREYSLRHCHLIPMHDEVALQKWKRAHRFGARKSSDRVLIYVQDGSDFFLIDVVEDPGAHEIMRMTDSKGRSFMQRCAQEADKFLSGELILKSA